MEAPHWTDSGVDWKHLVFALWQRKWWILATGVLGIVAGIFLARRAEPIYRTEATLWVQRAEDETGPIEGAQVLRGQGWAGLFTSLEVLKPIAREFRLYVRASGEASEEARDALFRDFTLVGDEDLLTGSFRLESTDSGYELIHKELGLLESRGMGEPIGEGAGFRWIPPRSALRGNSTIKFRLSTIAQAALSLQSRISVSYNPRSGNLINTVLEWDAGERGARVHNAVVDTFMQTAYRMKGAKLHEVTDILDQQLDYAAERLRNAELALEQFRVETVTLPSDQPQTTRTPGEESARDPVFSTFFDQKISASQLRAEIQVLEDHLAAARNGQLNAVALQLTSAVQQSQSLQSALEELTNLKAERRTLLQEFTEQHPDVQQVQQRIESLQSDAIPSQLEDLLSQLRTELRSLEGQIQSFASQLREVPTRSIEEARLRRNVEMAEQLHENLMTRHKEAELAASTAVPDLQVVDRAVPPSAPANDQGPHLFLLASMAGFGLGIFGALLHDHLVDNKVRFPNDVSQELGLAVLGVIPNLRRISSSDDRKMEVMETFRAVRAHLDRVEPRGGGVVLITSPAPQEGKSMTSANLAIAYAAQGRRVLLIDADTRRGDVHDMLACTGSPGFTDCLEGRISLSEAIKETPVNGLSLLARGSRPNQFNRNLLDSSALIRLLRDAERDYDTVVVDSPPLSAGVDALAIGEVVDKVLLVLRAAVSEKPLVERKLEMASRFGLPVVGALLNDVAGSQPFDYYKYYRYDAYEYSEYVDQQVEHLPRASA